MEAPAAAELQAEKEILGLIATDKARAFDLMVDRFGPMLYRYARRMCGNGPDAEDSLQEAFLIAQEKIGQFRGEGRLRNWLYRIVGNSCLQRYRRQKGRQATELRLDDVVTGQEPSYENAAEGPQSKWQYDPAEQMLSAELTARLEEAVAKVPTTNRSVLILRDLEGLSTRETAEALSISEEAVKVRLHRARAYVRNLLARYYEGKE
jgi:RNA polymerase sigma-70 factor (ECF subfamily)